MAGSPVIRVRGLVTRFGPQTVHDGLDLDVERGEVLGVVGGSGTGKSVLLKEILGLIDPAAGRIELLGHDTAELDRVERTALQARTGVLFQNGALFSSMTVAENVMLPLKEHTDLPPPLIAEMARVKIAMAGWNTLGSSRLPTFTITAGKAGGRVARCVPQFGQNSRVTAPSRSPRLKVFGWPLA